MKVVMVEGAISERTVVRAKIVALGLFLAFAPFAWARDVQNSAAILAHVPRFWTLASMYAGALLLSFAALGVAPFLRNHVVRVAFVGLFLGSFMIDRIVLATSGRHVDVTLLKMFWHNRSLAGAILSEFLLFIAPHVVAAAALGAVLAWPLSRGLRLGYAAIPVAALVVVPLQYSSWKGALEGYPSPLLVAARVSWILVKPSTHNDLAFRPVVIPRDRSAEARFDTIVFVMDESIRGDYLTINNPSIDTTPFLASTDRIINFGIAISGANCSVASRWMFRRGVRPWQLPNQPSLNDEPDGIVTGPRTTIWQFAKAAGFRTVFVDPFRTDIGVVHSGLDQRELALVDETIGLGGPRHTRDAQAAQVLMSSLKGSRRTFLYVDKTGANYPYDIDYPADFTRYTRPDGSPFVLYFPRSGADMLGAYKNAVSWNVDGFFREVLPQADLRRALIIYTSDHGENLWRDVPTYWRHCNTVDPAPVEAWVPLIALTGDERFDAALRSSAARSLNQASHFEIFPTLLKAMGYDANEVFASYGPDLLSIPTGRQRRFVTGDVIGPEYRRWVDAAAPGPGDEPRSAVR